MIVPLPGDADRETSFHDVGTSPMSGVQDLPSARQSRFVPLTTFNDSFNNTIRTCLNYSNPPATSCKFYVDRLAGQLKHDIYTVLTYYELYTCTNNFFIVFWHSAWTWLNGN